MHLERLFASFLVVSTRERSPIANLADLTESYDRSQERKQAGSETAGVSVVKIDQRRDVLGEDLQATLFLVVFVFCSFVVASANVCFSADLLIPLYTSRY